MQTTEAMIVIGAARAARRNLLFAAVLLSAANAAAADGIPTVKGKDLAALAASAAGSPAASGYFDDVGEFRAATNAGEDTFLEAAAYDQFRHPTDASFDPVVIDCPTNWSDPSYTLARSGRLNSGDAVEIKGRIDEMTATTRDMSDQGGPAKQVVHVLLLRPGCTITPRAP